MPQGQGYIIIENGQPVAEIPPGQAIPPQAIQAAMQGQIQIVDPQTGQPVNPSQLAGGPGGPPGGPGGPPGGPGGPGGQMPPDIMQAMAQLQQGMQQGTVMPPGGPGGPPGMGAMAGPAGGGAPPPMLGQDPLMAAMQPPPGPPNNDPNLIKERLMGGMTPPNIA